MTFTPTNRPVPSDAPEDLYFNSSLLDQYVNGSGETVIDRNGVERRTLAGIEGLAQEAIDAAVLSTKLYPDVATGLAATAVGGYFTVVSPVSTEYIILYRNEAGVAVPKKTYPSAELVALIDNKTKDIFRPSEVDPLPVSVTDPNGNAAIGVDREGRALIPYLLITTLGSRDPIPNLFYSFSVGDASGNLAVAYDLDGKKVFEVESAQQDESWKTVSLLTNDKIVHSVDSYSASYYTPKDKSYMAQLSQLSPYQHLNFGVSGDDLLDAQYRAINGSAATGATLKAMNARYFIIASLANDAQFRQADQSYYAENLRRLIDTVRAYGTEPIVATEFPASSVEHAFLYRVAQESGCGFIDCSTLNREVGDLQTGPFMQGTTIKHPGVRTNGVFWLAMLDFIDKMPRPDQAIKIFRRRTGWPVSTTADLLYKDRVDKAKRWKEITTFHFSFNTASTPKYDELSQLDYSGETFGFTAQADEYLRLSTGQSVAFTDYALLELTLPGNGVSLDAVELSLGVSGGTAQVFVRDYLDVAASMPGKIQGSSPTDPTYLSKWDKPRGAWRSLGSYSAPIIIQKTDLSRSMTGNTLVVMLSGAFNLTNLQVRYQGRELKSDLRNLRPESPIGSNLVPQPLCGTSGQLAAWTLTGTPAIVVPIDLYNAPRKPGANTPVDGVTVVTATDMIAQAVTLPADEGRPRRYRLYVWARYFPKAFLRPEVYPGLDPAQVIDRSLNPTAAPVTENTLDIRTLKCEIWNGSSYPAGGGAEFTDFAAMLHRPITFDYDAIPYTTGTTLNFRLSCPDGEIQISKVLLQEIQRWG